MSHLCVYLLEGSGEEAEGEEGVVVGHEGVGDADDDERPLREEKDGLAAEVVGQRREHHRAEYHPDHEDRLRQVLEVLAVTDQVPLKPHGSHGTVNYCSTKLSTIYSPLVLIN